MDVGLEIPEGLWGLKTILQTCMGCKGPNSSCTSPTGRLTPCCLDECDTWILAILENNQPFKRSIDMQGNDLAVPGPIQKDAAY